MFDTSSVTNVGRMFYDASAFNADISGWDVSSVTTLHNTFFKAKAFNQPIGIWDATCLAGRKQN